MTPTADIQTPELDRQPTATSFKVTCLAACSPRSVPLIMGGRIPVGQLSVLMGDPGEGKGLIVTRLAAAASKGSPLPGDDDAVLHGPTLWLCSEDGVDSTLRLRAEAAGADLHNVHVIGANSLGQALALPDHIRDLKQLVEEHGAKLLILDPITSFLGEKVNPHHNASLRRALTPLTDLCDQTGLTAVAILHVNKNSQETNARYRGTGSMAFVETARSVLAVGRLPGQQEVDEKEIARGLAVVKLNLGARPKALSYKITTKPVAGVLDPVSKEKKTEDIPVISWGDEVDVTADALLAGDGPQGAGRGEPGQQGARDDCVSFLVERLSKGPLPSAEIEAEARAGGFSSATYDRARKICCAKAFKPAGSIHWHTKLKGSP
jgi:hypothetical protein